VKITVRFVAPFAKYSSSLDLGISVPAYSSNLLMFTAGLKRSEVDWSEAWLLLMSTLPADVIGFIVVHHTQLASEC